MDSRDWDHVADNYFDELASPFSPGVKSPLKKAIASVKNSDKKTAIDLGCGIGNLIPYIAPQFKHVTAVDFSRKMLSEAKKRSEKHGNVELHQADLRSMKKFHNSFDVAFAINSLVAPSLVDVQKKFLETARVLKKGGLFIGVFPALDTDIYRAALTFDREYKKSKDERKAMKETRRLMDEKAYDFLFGLYDNEGRQKHYFREELLYRLQQAGFTDIAIDKVLYPWNLAEDPSLGKKKDIPHLFDWYVKAKKK